MTENTKNNVTDGVTLNWTDAKRNTLVALLDRLIPPNPARRVSGAGELGIAAILERQTQDDPAFRDALRSLLEACPSSDPDDTHTRLFQERVAQLEHDKPVPFAILLRATYMAYYSRPDVRAVLGLSSLPTQPRGYDVPVETPELLGALLEPVRSRGCRYRDA